MIKGFPKDRKILIWTKQGEVYTAQYAINYITGAEAFRVATHDDGTQIIVLLKLVTAWAEIPEKP